MMKLAIVIVAAVAPIAALAAPPLAFSGSEQLFGPAPPGAPYFTLPEGAPLDPKNSYIAVGVTGNRSGFVRVENLLTASSRLASKRVSEGTALAGSITIMPPNPGDRFGLTLSGATTDGKSAGSASATYRLSRNSLVFAAAARSTDHTLAKGGASFSFR